MRIYYHSVPEATSPNRHKIVAAVWESDYPAFDDREQSSGGPLPDGRLVLRIDETRTNMPPLIALARSLTMPRRPGRPTPPRYRVRPPDAIELPDDTYWVPETNLDRRGLLDPLPSGTVPLTRCTEIINDAAATAREKDLARMVRRLLLRVAQLET